MTERGPGKIGRRGVLKAGGLIAAGFFAAAALPTKDIVFHLSTLSVPKNLKGWEERLELLLKHKERLQENGKIAAIPTINLKINQASRKIIDLKKPKKLNY